MDLLSQRYANPYIILDDFIRLGQLHDFTFETMKTIAKEKEDDTKWQFYLHKVWNMTYEEYLAKCDSRPEKYEMDEKQVIDVIKQSESILEGFSI